ncbi:MAG: pilus assembly protein [Clostridiales bacterium]|nr:pilus assembly protein [Clostridiales bacterium]
MRREEKGALIVEATLVFPVMFFVLLLLLYMGNMFYMRSQVDAIVSMAATQAAAKCADPFLETVEENGSVPGTISDIQPYHSILGGSSAASDVRDDMVDRLNHLGTGFFAGMGLRNITVNEFAYENHLIYATFTVDVSYKIKFPIRLLGQKDATVLELHARSVVPVTDTGGFIQNVDMAVDYAQSTGLTEKLSKLKETVSGFLGG